MPGDLGQPWETRRGGLGTGLSFETPSLREAQLPTVSNRDWNVFRVSHGKHTRL